MNNWLKDSFRKKARSNRKGGRNTAFIFNQTVTGTKDSLPVIDVSGTPPIIKFNLKSNE